MSRVIAILGLQAYALLLTVVQLFGGGVRTDEAKYLLNIPYPQPPLIRSILGWTESFVHQETFWRVIFATLLIQAVWFVWDIGKNLPKEKCSILAAGWLLSASVMFQAGTIMMAPLTALFGLVFVWLLLRERGTPLVVGLLWLAALFTAYQAILYVPIIWIILRRREASLWQQFVYIDVPIFLVALYTLTNPLAVASFVNAGGENLTMPFYTWGLYLGRLWLTGGSVALTILGIVGMIRGAREPSFALNMQGLRTGRESRAGFNNHFALGASFFLVSAFCFVSFREYYDILFTPLFISGAYLFLKGSKVRVPRIAFLSVLIAATALIGYVVPPIMYLGPAREVMGAIEARDRTGLVLIHKYFGHEWQWESNLEIRRYRPALLEDAQAVVCLNPCEPFDRTGWSTVPDIEEVVWVRK